MFRRHLSCAAAIALSLGMIGSASAEEGMVEGPFPDHRGYGEYQQYCASCHGPIGDGNGPMSGALSVQPADLRLLASRFGRPLPRQRLSGFIDGRIRVRGHGSREMPVWGRKLFAQNQGNLAHESHVRGTIMVILEYIELLQIEPQDDKKEG